MGEVNGVNFQRCGVDDGEVLTIAKNFVMVSTALLFQVRGLVICYGFLRA